MYNLNMIDFAIYEKQDLESVQTALPVSDVVKDVIDVIPITQEIDGIEYITDFQTVSDNRATQRQTGILTALWQKGLDPLDLQDGNQWSEYMLEEVTVLTILEELNQRLNANAIAANATIDTDNLAQGVVIKFLI